ncbi:MAG TPA: hypothetical protein VGJ05_13595 [Fimbriiglobus sp.]|jgi:hypothetical protein
MRPLPLLLLVVGLFVFGYGGYCLYARFFGGPAVYWGEENVKSVAEKEKELDVWRAECDQNEKDYREFLTKLEAMPAGPAREEFGRGRDAIANVVASRQKLLKDNETFLELKLRERDTAKGLFLRRGILFMVLGLVWSVRAGMAAFAPVRRKPATAAPGPSPLSPRPDG